MDSFYNVVNIIVVQSLCSLTLHFKFSNMNIICFICHDLFFITIFNDRLNQAWHTTLKLDNFLIRMLSVVFNLVNLALMTETPNTDNLGNCVTFCDHSLIACCNLTISRQPFYKREVRCSPLPHFYHAPCMKVTKPGSIEYHSHHRVMQMSRCIAHWAKVGHHT